MLFITGFNGYIGRNLVEHLSGQSFTISGCDAFYYEGLTPQTINSRFIKKDIRDLEVSDLQGSSCLIHLAGLSNDPLCDLDESLTFEINYFATCRLAEIAKKSGVKKFIFMSSQSMYGISESNIDLSEDDPKLPITAYAKSKLYAESFLNTLSNENFKVICLRPSTVFGVSASFRSDIVFNNLLSSAYFLKNIILKTDGSPFRPVISINDVCKAISFFISAKTPNNFNYYNLGIWDGSKNINYTVKELAQTASEISSSPITIGTPDPDQRSYSVDFRKLFNEYSSNLDSLPCELLSEHGEKVLSFIDSLDIDFDTFKSKTSRLTELQSKINANIITENLRVIN
tara:strand:- start:312 stop:1340 length:1029 start_codon:yes stop_codon:yes gene_type:complete